MAFNGAQEAAAIAEAVAKQAAQYKPSPRKFANLVSHKDILYAIATDGTAWAWNHPVYQIWNKLDDLPAVPV